VEELAGAEENRQTDLDNEKQVSGDVLWPFHLFLLSRGLVGF
jgi:hypothetical protein